MGRRTRGPRPVHDRDRRLARRPRGRHRVRPHVRSRRGRSDAPRRSRLQRPGTGPDDPWAPFGAASLVLPTFGVANRGGTTSLTVAIAPDPASDVDPADVEGWWDALARDATAGERASAASDHERCRAHDRCPRDRRRTAGSCRLGADGRPLRRGGRAWPDRQGRAGAPGRDQGGDRPRHRRRPPSPGVERAREHDVRVHPGRHDVPRGDPGTARADGRALVRDGRDRRVGGTRRGSRRGRPARRRPAREREGSRGARGRGRDAHGPASRRSSSRSTSPRARPSCRSGTSSTS